MIRWVFAFLKVDVAYLCLELRDVLLMHLLLVQEKILLSLLQSIAEDCVCDLPWVVKQRVIYKILPMISTELIAAVAQQIISLWEVERNSLCYIRDWVYYFKVDIQILDNRVV